MFVGLQGTTQEARTQTANPTSAALRNADESSFQAPNEAKFVSGELLVKPRDGVYQQELEVLNRQKDARAQERLPGAGVRVIGLPAELPVQAAVRRYENSPDAQYAEPNFLLYPEATPNDPAYEKLYGLNNTGQQYANGTVGTPDADIDAPEAWNTETGNSDTVVVVIDTGVQTSHPDLDGNLWSNPEEAAGVSGTDDDRNGYVDDVRGWDFCHGDSSVYDSATYDDHGTHLAGTIAAEGNDAAGITGVNWDAQIMPLKFLDESVPFSSTNPCNSTVSAIKAIDYAVKEGARISNNSRGGAGYSQSLKNAIDRADTAGHLFVAAAGNGGDDGIGDDNDADEHYPSNYTSGNIISVAATDDDQLASFSNYGSASVDLGAPGVDTYSTVPNGSKYLTGTSMATPHSRGSRPCSRARIPFTVMSR